MLQVEGLTVRYGSRVALAGVDLTVADHETVCVLGPSGSGKSTLLRAIAGLEPVHEGTVRHHGIDLAGVPTHRRHLGLMFQDHALFPHRDVLGNVVFGLRMQGVEREAARTQARAAIARVGLSGSERRSVHELSGGEQQRVALARALAPEPDLLMLDEPLGALDRALREQLVEELAELFRASGLATLFVTHDHDEAFALADRVVILHAGRIEQVGTPVELWTRPANRFVAGFLGWNVTTALGPAAVAVRADAVRLVPRDDPARPRPAAVVRPARVTTRTFRRDHWRVRVTLDDGSTLDAEVRDAVPPEPGAARDVVVAAEDLVPLPD